MNHARERILDRLRGVAMPAPKPLPAIDSWYSKRQRDENNTQRVARLRSALEGAHAEVHEVTAADWAERLLVIAASKGLHSLLIGADTPHGNALAALPQSSLKLVPYTETIETWRDELFNHIDASLTLARSAIAETGSLILWPSSVEPRLMSLVPSVHIVLLDVADDVAKIHADFHSAQRDERWHEGLPANVLLVSGPSKTADIQQTLAYGAHGPRELIVLLRHADARVPEAAA